MSMETTLVLIKPDWVEEGNTGEIISMIEKFTNEVGERVFTILGTKMLELDDDIIREHYSSLVDESFFPEIVEYMKSTPVVAMAIRGENAISEMRNLVGVTDPEKADEGTIRRLFGKEIGRNAVHASDSEESAEEELKRFFKKGEIFKPYKLDNSSELNNIQKAKVYSES